MLGLCALAGLGFVALFILDPNTQLLALCLGAALALLAGALIIAGRFLVPQETTVEQRPMYGDHEASAEVAEQLERGLDGITRRRAPRGSGEHRGRRHRRSGRDPGRRPRPRGRGAAQQDPLASRPGPGR